MKPLGGRVSIAGATRRAGRGIAHAPSLVAPPHDGILARPVVSRST